MFDQVLEGLPAEEQKAIFKAYIGALDQDPDQYRRDAENWENWAKGLGGAPSFRPHIIQILLRNGRKGLPPQKDEREHSILFLSLKNALRTTSVLPDWESRRNPGPNDTSLCAPS